MTSQKIPLKIAAIARSQTSPWMEKARWRRENRGWLNTSFEIALKILENLEDKGWKQKDLAEKMGVSPQQISKIVKGRENLSLATIAKLEYILQSKLLTAPGFENRPEH